MFIKKIVQLCLLLLLMISGVIWVGLKVNSAKVAQNSKAKIVEEIRSFQAQSRVLLDNSGTVAQEGYKYYLPVETEALYQIYQAIQVRLNYLTTGKWQLESTWQAHSLIKSNNFPPIKMVTEILTKLNQEKIPRSFWNKLKIFLLPYVIPQISGLGGAGFVILAATPEDQVLTRTQLEVTLLHELGHNVHEFYLPKDTWQGIADWQRYLKLRGGQWHDSGMVNTKAWSDSTEETFAEDFRMLFGSDQPFYNDLSLGDPRVKPEIATKLRELMLDEFNGKVRFVDESPWMPNGFWVTFWLNQAILLLIVWLLVIILGCVRIQRLGLIFKQNKITLRSGTSAKTLT